MKRDNKQKVIIAVILVLVLSVSIGFAAFSSSLKIKSKLTINQGIDPTAFNVVFSSNSSKLETNEIIPTKTGTNSSKIEVNNGIIDNTSYTYPTIQNLGASFTESGQSVTYKLYSLNNGEYDAFLTSIVFNNLPSGNFIECTPTNDASEDLVSQACEGISVSVIVGNTTSTQISANSTMLGIQNHTLNKGESEIVLVTFSYNSGVILDGSFDVSVGNIYLTYGNKMTSEMPELSDGQVCAAVNSSQSGNTNIGTKYNCAVNSNESYNFYVLSTSGDSVSLIMESNLVERVLFSTSTERDYIAGGNYGMCPDVDIATYYAVTSNEVPNAITKLKDLTYNWTNIPALNEKFISDVYSVDLTGSRARLATFEEITTNGCTTKYEGGYPNNAPYYGNCKFWIRGNYWTMQVGNFEYTGNTLSAWAVNTLYNTYDDFSLHATQDCEGFEVTPLLFGIRPVITLDKSMLG